MRLRSWLSCCYTLEQHLADAATRALIQGASPTGERWNVVVLHEQSELPAHAYADPTVRKTTLNSAVGLCRPIKDSNPQARVVLFEIWARFAAPWATAHPIPLHAADGSHPDFAGSHAAALDIFTTVCGASPMSVTYRGELTEADGERLREVGGWALRNELARAGRIKPSSLAAL